MDAQQPDPVRSVCCLPPQRPLVVALAAADGLAVPLTPGHFGDGWFECHYTRPLASRGKGRAPASLTEG